MPKTFTLIVTPEELNLLDVALESAIDDCEHYLKHGDPEADYGGDLDDLTSIKQRPDQWLELRERILQLEQDARAAESPNC